METVWKVLTRKKILDPVTAEQSELGRVLNTFDLTALGVGSTLGVGVYVLAGQVAKETAGPSVVLSFLIATIASVFAGLCYAEFGARAPRAGSAYIYSYVCVGEFIAFVIGWNLILEYVIGSASVARGLSLYLDTLINDTLKNTFTEIAPINGISFMSEYFDFFAFGVSVILSVALAFGMRESSLVNNIITVLNLMVVLFVIIAGSIKANTDNWHQSANKTDPNIGEGGFFPFGVEGMIKGAATCFYGFVGFDCIATTGEEVKNPKRAIPIAIVLSLFIIFLAYFGTSTVVTLMVPYYDQDPNAPIPYAFEHVGYGWAKWIVAIGAIFGLCASLFGAMFPLPRIIYAMASDSLVFRFLGKVNPRFKTPVVGTLLAGLLTGLMAALFDLKQLVNMMSIGTLLAYTIVAASVLLLRYEIDKGEVYEPLLDSEESDTYTDNRGMDDIGTTSEEIDFMTSDYTPSVWKQIFNCGRYDVPNDVSEKIVKIEVCLYCILCVLIGLCAMQLNSQISSGEIWAIVLTTVVICLTVLVMMSMATQPKSRKELSFKVPLIPLIPALSILVNIYLMLMLDYFTWIRFAVWMAIGLPTYYFSVQTHSDARNESISSKTLPNGKLNGFANHAYISEEPMMEITKKKQAPPPPPTMTKIESTIAVLDEILENEEASIDRKISVDSVSIASNVLHEENVKADVHCADIPLTPVQVVDDPLQTKDANPPPPPSPPSKHIDTLNDLTKTETIQEDDKEPEEVSEPNDLSIEIDIDPEGVVVVDEKLPEKKQSEDDGNGSIPPPPPFLQESEEENKDISIPRIKFQPNALSAVKLKHRKPPEIPPVDYSRQNSEAFPESEDNIKFGTQEHKEFLNKLNQTLQQGGYVPTQVIFNLSKKPSVKKQPFVPNEDVIEDNIDRDVAKEKLAQFLERSYNSIPFTSQDSNNEDNIKEKREWKNEYFDEEDMKKNHKHDMQDVFGSIRGLKKADSFRTETENNSLETENKEVEKQEEQTGDKDEDRLRHRENMDSIFKNIKLRKVDSFKTQD